MTVRVYRSSDASAPSLTGTAGSLVAILDACLVNGYGALAASGWAKEFSGTNKAVYRAPSGNRFRLRVDDVAAQDARLVAYESMSGVDTGTQPFPTGAQFSGGLYCRKSASADGTVRSWVLVATQTAMYFFPHDGGSDWLVQTSYVTVSGQFFFGDFPSLLSGDTHNTLLVGGVSGGSGGSRLGALLSPSIYSTPGGHFLARDYTLAGGSVTAFKRSLLDPTPATVAGAYTYRSPFPDPVTGNLQVSPVGIYEQTGASAYTLRGTMPGLYDPLHNLPANHGDTVNGGGALSGKTFQLALCGYSTTTGRLMIEISDTW